MAISGYWWLLVTIISDRSARYVACAHIVVGTARVAEKFWLRVCTNGTSVPGLPLKVKIRGLPFLNLRGLPFLQCEVIVQKCLYELN